MSQRVAAHVLGNAGRARRVLDPTAKVILVQVMPPDHAATRVHRIFVRGKHELPAPFVRGARVLARERVRQFNITIAGGEVALMQSLHTQKMGLQRLDDGFRQHRNAVFAALSLSLELALINFNAIEAQKITAEMRNLRFGQLLGDVSAGQYMSYHRVTAASHLVYATALFDSFLTDTTRFLFLRDPNKLGNRAPVLWETFINSQARVPTIIEAVTKRARDVAFWPFLRRIEFLNKTFGLAVSPQAPLLANLERVAGIRNAIVHDHTMFEPSIDEGGAVVVKKRELEHHELESMEVRSAMRTFASVGRLIFSEVCEKVLAAADDPDYKTTVDSAFFPSKWEESLDDEPTPSAAGENANSAELPANN